jgi:hypothetical protein
VSAFLRRATALVLFVVAYEAKTVPVEIGEAGISGAAGSAGTCVDLGSACASAAECCSAFCEHGACVYELLRCRSGVLELDRVRLGARLLTALYPNRRLARSVR